MPTTAQPTLKIDLQKLAPSPEIRHSIGVGTTGKVKKIYSSFAIIPRKSNHEVIYFNATYHGKQAYHITVSLNRHILTRLPYSFIGAESSRFQNLRHYRINKRVDSQLTHGAKINNLLAYSMGE